MQVICVFLLLLSFVCCEDCTDLIASNSNHGLSYENPANLNRYIEEDFIFKYINCFFLKKILFVYFRFFISQSSRFVEFSFQDVSKPVMVNTLGFRFPQYFGGLSGDAQVFFIIAKEVDDTWVAIYNGYVNVYYYSRTNTLQNETNTSNTDYIGYIF